MLVFDSLETGPLATNCYIVGDSETKETAVVDPGGHVGAIRSALDRHGLTCKYIINTHAHFDHVGGNAELKRATGAELLIHPEEAGWLLQLKAQARMFGLAASDSPAADRTLAEGDVVELGQVRLEVRHTPGHSPGSISLVIAGAKKILVGDLVFAGSIGRTDLPGGSLEALRQSVFEKIFCHPDDTQLFPGHGPRTSVGVEKRTNPFLGEDAPY
ncbi:MAG TPA: MBL fold metallo-hydrolase [Myxococcota bacterium]|nr:MBL fold metallo-hydrolase [Myxococcota bacterium]HRY92130.1 MBL fold metallo-hydrolase [Myxococcota bacterium]HSA21729.1 MBL fold metallo-hydrolase [Myxococcota bacterium]